MKKTVLIIALVLLMVAPVFAAAGESRGTPSSTLTQLDVDMQPSYKYNVTASAFADAAAAEAWDGTSDVKAVEMVRNGSTENIKQKDNTTYFVSYMFYEYENVDLKISTSGNLQDEDKKYSIPFQVTVAEVTNNFAQSETPSKATTGAVTILSSKSAEADGTATILSIDKPTNILGDYAYGSASLTVSNAVDNCLKGMPDLTYTAYIKLSVVTNG